MKPPFISRDVPSYDAAAVARVRKVVRLRTIALTYAHFSAEDEGELPFFAPAEPTLAPEIGAGAIWSAAESGKELGCLISFGTRFPEDNVPYTFQAEFRVSYDVDGDLPDHDDVDRFVHWDTAYNVWPYWREYVASTLNRAQLPRVTVPAMPNPS